MAYLADCPEPCKHGEPQFIRTSMIEPHITQEIRRRLGEAEREHDVKVIWAVESGSRAWGFASPNSDYDARFIYVNRPEWYLSVGLEEKRDVIEYPIVDELDVNGWDLRKALRLFWKSNPAFVEWIQSPIVYTELGSFAQQCQDLVPQVYSVESGIYHYRSMAKSNSVATCANLSYPLKNTFTCCVRCYRSAGSRGTERQHPSNFANCSRCLTMMQDYCWQLINSRARSVQALSLVCRHRFRPSRISS